MSNLITDGHNKTEQGERKIETDSREANGRIVQGRR